MSLTSTTSRGYLGHVPSPRSSACRGSDFRELLHAVENASWFSSVQHAHSKLQKPPPAPAPRSGTAAAATNTQWQERTAADVTRPGRSEERRVGKECRSRRSPYH